MNLIKQSAGVCACLDVSRIVWMQLHCIGFWHICVIQMSACSEILAEIQKKKLKIVHMCNEQACKQVSVRACM